MAVYRFSASIIKRSGGRSATAAAAYRSGERIYDERTGLDHDYRRKSGIEYTEIITPEASPAWMKDRAKLWNAVEKGEKRKDAQLSREVQLSLPHELKDWQRVELVREFVRDQFVSLGMVADLSVHKPDRQSDRRNFHAHVMLTLREVTGEGFGGKNRSWNDRKFVETWRKEWERYQNRALEKAGRSERVDHRSNEEQGLDREPEPKLGPHASEMEKKGKKSERGDLLREVWERNRKRDELKREAEAITGALKKEDQARAMKDSYRQAAGRRDAIGRPEDKDKAAEQKNEKWSVLQYRHYEEKEKLASRHDRQREALEEQLKEFYGPGIKKARKTIAGFEKGAHRDEAEVRAAKKNLANIESRMAEQREGLALKQQAEREKLEASQEMEKEKLARAAGDKQTAGKKEKKTAGPGQRDKAAEQENGKRRSEEMANEKRSELQNRHHEAAGELARRHERQRADLEEKLKEFYGPGMKEARKTIASFEKGESRDIEAARAAKKNLANIESRMAEQRGKLARNQLSEREKMEASQKLEREELARAAGGRQEAGKKERKTAGPGQRDKAAVQENEKRRFEEWANEKRAELQNQRNEDKGELGRRHERQRVNLEDKLKEFYGPGMKKARKTIAEAESRKQSGRFKRLTHRVSGRARRDIEAAQAARKSLADIESRMAEQRGELARNQLSEREKMEASHEVQKMKLENRIDQARQRREKAGWKRDIPKDGRKKATGREGPGFSS
jgi:hypothetical protein